AGRCAPAASIGAAAARIASIRRMVGKPTKQGMGQPERACPPERPGCTFLDMRNASRFLATVGMTALAFARPVTAQAKRATPPAVQHYFDLVRPLFSGQRAYDQVAFMDQYFRWPGNTGFNASIRRVEGILKDAGYVNEANAKPGDVLTY